MIVQQQIYNGDHRPITYCSPPLFFNMAIFSNLLQSADRQKRPTQTMTNNKCIPKTVFVTVGTTRFDNLVRQVVSDEMCQKFRQAGFKRMIVQTGSSPIPIQTQVCGLDVHCYDYKASIHDDIKNADLVISHAGAGTVLESLSLGKPLITVVNEKLMNNHQMELAQQMHKDGHSVYCTCSTLQETLAKLDVNALCRFTPGDPTKFGNFMDKLVGFS